MLTQVEIMEIVVENFYKDFFSPFSLSYQDTNTNHLCEVGYLLGIIGLLLKKDPFSTPMVGTVLILFGAHELSSVLMDSCTTTTCLVHSHQTCCGLTALPFYS